MKILESISLGKIERKEGTWELTRDFDFIGQEPARVLEPIEKRIPGWAVIYGLGVGSPLLCLP